jgi:hypothetical protein
MSPSINPARRQFGLLLKDKIYNKFKSLREFARVAEAEALEASIIGHLSMITNAIKPPPIKKVRAWADALDIDDPAERVDFFHTAIEATLSPATVSLLRETQRLEASLTAEETA